MTDADFRSFVLDLPGTDEGEHEGLPTFRVAGRRFATLGWPEPHKVALILTPEQQGMLLEACPRDVRPAAGAWGRRGHSQLDLATAADDTVRSVVMMAWRRCAPRRLARMLGDDRAG